jgi:hypothetical protein
MIGRCLRPSPGKAAAVILDHVGNTLRLGHHLEPREWTLEGLAKRDREAAPSVKVCPQCFAAMASQAKQCGECGHTFAAEVRELQQVEGELVELKHNEVKQLKKGMKVGYGNNPPNGHQIGPYTILTIDHDFWAFLAWNGECSHKALIKDLVPWHDPLQQRRQQGTAQTLDDLRELAQQRGYKRGWAERVYQARLAKRHGV